jgi:hypothetical protein
MACGNSRLLCGGCSPCCGFLGGGTLLCGNGFALLRGFLGGCALFSSGCTFLCCFCLCLISREDSLSQLVLPILELLCWRHMLVSLLLFLCGRYLRCGLC